jgi:putative transposase
MAGRFVCNLVHFVWSTDHRRDGIAESWENGLYAYIGGIARNKKATLLQAANYIRLQKSHHRKRDFRTEFLDLLRRHEIDFDAEYIWK